MMRTSKSGKYKNTSVAPAPQPIISTKINFAGLGLSGYRKTARVIVSWTVRIEAYMEVVSPATFCDPWNGKIDEHFTGGEVDTMLYLANKQIGNSATMTFPALGVVTGESYNPPPPPEPSDPTITNSVTINPIDLPGGEFPESFDLNVMWVNKTIGSTVKAPAFMRNMTIFILPIGN